MLPFAPMFTCFNFFLSNCSFTNSPIIDQDLITDRQTVAVIFIIHLSFQALAKEERVKRRQLQKEEKEKMLRIAKSKDRENKETEGIFKNSFVMFV